MCRRRHDLSFAHHREVAALPPDEADALSRRDFRDLSRVLTDAPAQVRCQRYQI